MPKITNYVTYAKDITLFKLSKNNLLATIYDIPDI